MSNPPRPAPPTPTIDLLLNLIDTRPQSVLTSLTHHPQLAHASDAHGYSLLHAASSYAQLDVLRTLVHTYKVDVNKLDEDGETALFAAETEEVARVLVGELSIDWRILNLESQTAEEKIAVEEGADHPVATYLRGLRETESAAAGGAVGSTGAAQEQEEGLHHPPPLPNGVKINVGTMDEETEESAPDPEFRRRIEELAARDDFQSEEGQRQLRELVTEAVTGLGTEAHGGRNVRRRVE